MTAARPAGQVATLRCPACGETSIGTMPTDACQYFFDCQHCSAVIRPKAGDCCVFCSYGDQLCPPKVAESCCSAD